MIGKRLVPARIVDDRTYSDEVTVNGRRLVRGAEVHLAGIRGRCVFVRHCVMHETGDESVDVVTARGFSRTRPLADVEIVHRTRRVGVA